MYRRIFLPLLLCLNACGSLTIWESPKFRGMVIDEKGSAIEGVQISDVSQTRKTSKILAKTDGNGNFDLIPRYEQIYPIAPGCYGSQQGSFLFEKDLYDSATVPYNITCGGGEMPSMLDVKVVLKFKKKRE